VQDERTRPGSPNDFTRLTVTDGTLETERLVLRRLTPADAHALFSVTGDPAVMRHWWPGPDADISATAERIAIIQAHWPEHGFGDYGVVARDQDRIVGFAGLHHIAGMTEVNIGYALLPSVWRRGLGTELCAALLEHGFGVLGLPGIVAVVDPRNAPSIALARRSGLTLRDEITWQGQRRLVLAITRMQALEANGPSSDLRRPNGSLRRSG
jgi:[ribosomal protein S5]-alanine N-acetyltransferase